VERSEKREYASSPLFLLSFLAPLHSLLGPNG